jgi:hypothetical protein
MADLAGLQLRDHCRGCLVGEAILQAGVPELVDRSHGAQDLAFAGVFEESHKADGYVLTPGQLDEFKRNWPRFGVSKPEYQPGH